MTDTDIKALVQRLREVKTTDHDRGCQGREYACSCGWDDRIWAVAIEAADVLEALQTRMKADRIICHNEYADRFAEAKARAEKAEAQRDEAEHEIARLREVQIFLATRAEKAEAENEHYASENRDLWKLSMEKGEEIEQLREELSVNRTALEMKHDEIERLRTALKEKAP